MDRGESVAILRTENVNQIWKFDEEKKTNQQSGCAHLKCHFYPIWKKEKSSSDKSRSMDETSSRSDTLFCFTHFAAMNCV